MTMIRYGLAAWFAASACVGCGADPENDNAIESSIEPISTSNIAVSMSADRTHSAPLDGKTVKGNVFVFSTAKTGLVSYVAFFIDGMLHTTERIAPYDIEGGTPAAANALDTRKLGDGVHTITMAYHFTGGTVVTLKASFTIDNVADGTSPPPPPPPVNGVPAAPATPATSVRDAVGVTAFDQDEFVSRFGRTPRFRVKYSVRTSWTPWRSTVGDILDDSGWKNGSTTTILSLAPLMLESDDASDPRSLDAGAAGKYDANWTWLGQKLDGLTQAQLDRLFIRFGWEMTGRWYRWGLDTSTDAPKTNTPAAFSAYWKRAYGLVHAAMHGKRVRWDFNVAAGNIDLGEQAFPGKDYASVYTLDCYSTWEFAKDFANARTKVFDRVASFAAAKGVLVGVDETSIASKVEGTVQRGSDDYPEWYTGIAAWADEQVRAHRLSHIVFFEHDPVNEQAYYAVVAPERMISGRESQTYNFPRSAAELLRRFK